MRTHRRAVLERADHAHSPAVSGDDLDGVEAVDVLHAQLPAVAAAHQRVLAPHEGHAQDRQGVVAEGAQRAEAAVDQLPVCTRPACNIIFIFTCFLLLQRTLFIINVYYLFRNSINH